MQSSDEETGENGEKKEKENKKKKKKKEVVAAQCETEEKLPAGRGHEDGKEKGFMEKMKDKLPGGHHGKPEAEAHNDKGKEKGFMEKIKEKLPGHTNDETKKET